MYFVDPPPPPTRDDVAGVIRGLITGDTSRADASAWAFQWVAADSRVDDPVVWKALNYLAGADAPTTDRPWLFEEIDFRAWLEDVTGSTDTVG
jgi:hypothetical protein